jgi:hypothetical protein
MSTPATVPTEAEIVKWIQEKPWIRKELGEYEQPCLDFVERVSQLDGVVTIGVIPYAGYVDLWTVTERDDRHLGKAIIEHFIDVVRKSERGLLFDFMTTSKREHLPEEAVVLYEKET